MQPSRRRLLKQVLFVSVGYSIIPSCLLVPQDSGIRLKHIQVTADQEMLLASIADTLIPSDDAPGAKATESDLYVWKILDDCSKEKDQKLFLKGLNEFGKIAQLKLGKFFTNATVVERERFLHMLNEQNSDSTVLLDFYQNAKKRIIQAHTGSAYFLNNIQQYEQIPARFHGSVLIKS